MSFIHKVGVLGDPVLGDLQLLVVSAPRHMLQHLFGFVSEGGREVCLLDLTFDLAPLRALNGLLDAVGAGPGAVLLGDDPRRARFRFGLHDVGRVGLGLGPLEVCIVVFGGWNLHRKPLLVLREVDARVLAENRNRNKDGWGLVQDWLDLQSVVARRFYQLLELLLVVELAGCWQLILIFHDLVCERLAIGAKELARPPLDILPPVRVLHVFGPGDVIQPFRF